MKRNILLIGNDGISNLENSYFKAFKKIGFSVEFYRIDRNIKNRIISKFESLFPSIKNYFLQQKLINYLKKNKRKYYFIFLFKGTYLNLRTLKFIKSIKKTIWINYFPDDPFNVKNNSISNLEFIKLIPEFDIFCIWSKKIKIKLEKKFKNNYFLYLPFAYDSLNNFRKKKRKKFKNIITFIGTHDSEREKVIKSIKFEKEVFGGNWKRLSSFNKSNIKINGHLHGKNMSDKIMSSAISLNILRRQNKTAHNMKTFEIPGNYGLMLTTRSKEQNEYFRENHSSFMYSNTKELNDKIKFILKNSKISNKVRERGYRLAQKQNYLNRAKILIKKINEFKRK